MNSRSWIVCQMGARQHYSVPFALHQFGSLDSLITDIWFVPTSLAARWNRNLAGRYHPGLRKIPLYSFNYRAVVFEAAAHLRGVSGWKLMEERNEWFQRYAIRNLADRKRSDLVLHSFSYAALNLFEYAKSRGWWTVMQQIDPGPVEERIVAELYAAHPELQGNWQMASQTYWDNWRKECSLVDSIVVNSNWSRRALIDEVVSPQKIHIIPLAYESSGQAGSFTRMYPAEFNARRPLR